MEYYGEWSCDSAKEHVLSAFASNEEDILTIPGEFGKREDGWLRWMENTEIPTKH